MCFLFRAFRKCLQYKFECYNRWCRILSYCFVFFDASDLYLGQFVLSHCALYIERLKQSGYWFILCLHQIPFTFKMLFPPGRQCRSDYAQTKRELSAGTSTIKPARDGLAPKTDADVLQIITTSVQDGALESHRRKAGQINAPMTSMKWLIIQRT